MAPITQLYSGPVKEKNVGDVIDDLVTGFSPRLAILFTVTTLYGYVCNIQSYITFFTGNVPYNSWECISTLCYTIISNSTVTSSPFSSETLCKANLIHEKDFRWVTDGRTSFATDLGFYCDQEYKVSVIGATYFIGGYLALLISTNWFDKFGRKPITLIFGFIGFGATFLGYFCNSFTTLVVMRFFQGAGRTVCWTGLYCWILEYFPTKMRNIFNGVILMTTAFGMLLLSLIAYYFKDWHLIFLVSSFLVLAALIPLFFVPESPRHLLLQGKEKEARKVIIKYSKALGKEISLDDTVFTKVMNETMRNRSCCHQIKDFSRLPRMTRNVLLLMLNWLVTSILFYGFNFGWSKIIPNPYLSYIFAGIGDAISCIWIIPITELLGRKRSMLSFEVLALVSFLTATIPVNIYGSFNFEQASSLMGFMFINSAYASNYLYTSEVSPTSHRGSILSLCSGIGRVGSLFGPFTTLLFEAAGHHCTFYIFSGITLLTMIAIFFTDDPTNKPLSEVPEQMSIAESSAYRRLNENRV